MNDKSVLKVLVKGDFKESMLHRAFLFKRESRKELFKLARKRHTEYFPSRIVEVRSVIEISNICQRKCNFCNINLYSRSKKDTYLNTETA